MALRSQFRTLACVFGLLLAAPLTAAAPAALPLGEAIPIDEELHVTRIARGVFVVVHERPWAANALLVEMADGTLVLCDTPYDDRSTGRLLGWIRRTFGPRTVVAVNSHFHADAMGGNGALHRAGIETVGSEASARLLQERGAGLKAALLEHLAEQPDLQARFRDVEWEPPVRRFQADAGLELRFGGERVVLHHPGPAHSPDNIVTWFPERRLLFGGCMVRTGRTLPSVSDADLEGWPAAVENLRRFDAATVVPGHGPPGGPELLDVTLRAIATFRAENPGSASGE